MLTTHSPPRFTNTTSGSISRVCSRLYRRPGRGSSVRINSTAACASSARDLRSARQVLHVALLQQRQVLVHNQRRHFHRPPPLFKLRLGLGPEAAVRMRIRLRPRPAAAPYNWLKLLLLRRNLDQQALAQIARPTPAGSRCCTRSMPRAFTVIAAGPALPACPLVRSATCCARSAAASSSSLAAR